MSKRRQFSGLHAAYNFVIPEPGRRLDWIGWCVMRRIIQANIDRFKALLQTETDPTKQAMEARLLAEEEAKLKQLDKPDERKAY